MVGTVSTIREKGGSGPGELRGEGTGTIDGGEVGVRSKQSQSGRVTRVDKGVVGKNGEKGKESSGGVERERTTKKGGGK